MYNVPIIELQLIANLVFSILSLALPIYIAFKAESQILGFNFKQNDNLKSSMIKNMNHLACFMYKTIVSENLEEKRSA